LQVHAAENGTSRERVGTNGTKLAQAVLSMFLVNLSSTNA
jgi:hypothetical protein